MEKVLIVGMHATTGGIGTFIFNCVSSTYHQIRYDFLFQGKDQTMFKQEEFKRFGCSIYKYDYISLKHPFNMINEERKIAKFLVNNKYDCVWINESMPIENTVLDAAYKAKVKRIIYHSHNSANMITGWRRLPYYLLFRIARIRINKKATDFWACSNLAAKWMFSKKNISSDKYLFVPNAIDLSKFKFDENSRQEIRQKLGINNNTVVIGNIGRLTFQKDPIRGLEIFNEYHKSNPNSVYIIAGDGDLKSKLKEKVAKMRLNNYVKVLGDVNYVSALLNAFDLVLFPTRFEGLSISLLEEQGNGLPIVCSSNVSEEVNISNNVFFVNRKMSNKKWAKVLGNCESLINI